MLQLTRICGGSGPDGLQWSDLAAARGDGVTWTPGHHETCIMNASEKYHFCEPQS